MAKKKVAAKQVKTSAFSRAKARWDTFGSGRKVLSIVLLAAAGYCLLYIGQVIVQKIQFDAEKRSIHKVYEQIITELGPPATGGVKSKCNYQNLKYSRGDRTCSTSIHLEYSVQDVTSAQDIILRTHNNVLSKYKIVYQTTPNLSIGEVVKKNSIMTIAGDININEQSGRCGFEYKYFNKSNDVTKKTISISTGCYGDAKFEFFSVEE